MSTLAQLLMGGGGKVVPTEPGTPFGGGYYAGRFITGGQEYALVVAPKTQGETEAQWRVSNANTVGAGSVNNGRTNTDAMIQEGAALYPAAAFCSGLNINGYDDWYLPSKDELEILYRNFKPTTNNNSTSYGANPSAIPPTGNYTAGNPAQTTVAAFKPGGGDEFATGLYWSSTQHTTNTAYLHRFLDGFQGDTNKYATLTVRAVRRVLL